MEIGGFLGVNLSRPRCGGYRLWLPAVVQSTFDLKRLQVRLRAPGRRRVPGGGVGLGCREPARAGGRARRFKWTSLDFG